MSTTSLRALVSSILALVLISACVEPTDMTRPDYERGTLGEEVYNQLYRDLLRSPENGVGKAAAIEAEREAFINAIDTLLPADEIPPFEEFMLELLPYYDDERIPDLVRKLAFIYDGVEENEGLRDAWVRTRQVRSGYQHETTDTDIIERIIAFPRLRELTLFTTDLILDHDGVDEHGQPDPSENDYFRRLMLSVRDELNAPADPADIHRNVALLADLLLRPDTRFAGLTTPSPMWAVNLDPRGLVEASVSGQVLLPFFTDADGDGLPDVDTDGRFLDRDLNAFVVRPYGQPREVFHPVPSQGSVTRDELGRAFDENGQPMFNYLDLNHTSLGYVVRRAPELVERAVLVDTFSGLEGILGELDRSGEYPHYTTETPLLDVADAALRAIDFDTAPSLLTGLSMLLEGHTAEIATLIVTFDSYSGIGERYDAHTEPDNTLFDDLLPYLYEISQHKGLLDELVTVLQDPMTNRALLSLAELNGVYNDAIRPALDGPYNTAVAPCFELDGGSVERYDCIRNIGESERSEIYSLTDQVDHTLPEGPGNTSLAQRTLHLIHDGTDGDFSMIIEEARIGDWDISELADLGALITIEGVSAAYFDSIAGNFCLEDQVNLDALHENALLELLVDLLDALGLVNNDEDLAKMVADLIVLLSDSLGVHLDPCPGPNQLLRFFNLPVYELNLGPVYLRLANGHCGAGYVYQEHHTDTLYAAEASGVTDGLYPLMKVLSDRGLAQLLAELIHDVYHHYPEYGANYRLADGTPEDFDESGLRSFEPVLIEVFEDERVAPAVQDLLAAIQSIEPTPEQGLVTALEGAVEHLFDETTGVTNRRGDDMTQQADGVLTPMTHFYLLMDAFDRVDLWIDGTESEDAWSRSADELVDLLLKTIEEPDGSGRFEDPGSPALATALTAHLGYQLQRKLTAGELHSALTDDYIEGIEEAITSRGFAAVVELVNDVRSDPADQELFDELMLYLTEEDEATIRMGATVLFDLLLGTTDRFAYPSVAPFFANLFDPDRQFAVDATADLAMVTHIAQVLREIVVIDEDEVAMDVIRRGFITPRNGDDAPLAVIGRVIRQINRVDAGSTEEVSSEDLRALCQAVADYIRDEHRGFERAFSLIQDRRGPQRRAGD